ncbi:acetyltransferase [Caloranaerobacter ferrireducens]|uniref:acetyltransferase n=1 Tax=Caloranaerobacter ferrireducens TaxID=1323370 RepID=UPI00084D8E30|nr:acetyltransferase [Caloranaerobacter ferrireducens]
MKEKVILIGGGGHCKVVIDAIKRENRYEIVGITDIRSIGEKVLNVPIIGNDSKLQEIRNSGINKALITLGSIKDNSYRISLYDKVKRIGFSFINVIHPQAIIGEQVFMENGNVILPGVIINACTRIGNNCIINTGSIIEHDCVIGDHVHISPGVKIAGGVKIGKGSFIGIGSTIIQGVKIGNNVTIGAGAVVIEDIPDNAIVVGIPAKNIKYKDDENEKRY